MATLIIIVKKDPWERYPYRFLKMKLESHLKEKSDSACFILWISYCNLEISILKSEWLQMHKIWFLMHSQECMEAFTCRGVTQIHLNVLGITDISLVNYKLALTKSIAQRRQWHPTPVLLPGKIPWTEEPGRLQSMGSLTVRHNWDTSLSLFTSHALEKEMKTHSSVLAWQIPGMWEPGGLPSLGSHRVRNNWSGLAVAARALPMTERQGVCNLPILR